MAAALSATLENEADATLETRPPVARFLVCIVLGSDAGEGVDATVAEPVAGAFEGQDVGVVNDAVDHRGGDGLVAEDAAPAAEGQVGGQDQRGVLVAAGHELEEQVGGVLLEG